MKFCVLIIASLLGGAPAPKYLSVPGFESCLGSKDHGSWTGRCLPLSKPKSCLDESWAQLKNLKFDLCVAPNPNGEDIQKVGGAPEPESVSGTIPQAPAEYASAPEYLRVPGFESLNEESTAGEWKLIQTSDFNGASNANGADMQKVGLPAPEYLSVPGFDVCLGINDLGISEHHRSWTWRCLPLSKPKSCLDESWAKLKKMKFDLCVAPNPNAEDMQNEAEHAGTETPEDLSVPGFRHLVSCLGNPKPKIWCLPLGKPKACLDESWAKLKKMKLGLCVAPNPNGEDM